MRRLMLAVRVLAGTLVLATCASASGPRLVNYQGILTDEAGIPLAGDVRLTFSIYADSAQGSPLLWLEAHPSVTLDEGLFNVILGGSTPFASDLFQRDELWMGITIDTEPEIVPRMPLTSVPWAMHAAVADTAMVGIGVADGDWVVVGNDMYAGVSGNVGIGTTTPACDLEIYGGVLRVKRSATQYTEYRCNNYLGHYITAMSPLTARKPLRLQCLHDGVGTPGDNMYFAFDIGDVSSPTRAMTIRDDGRIGINIADPARLVELYDPNQAYLRLTSAGSGVASTLELKGSTAGALDRLGAVNFVDNADQLKGAITYQTAHTFPDYWMMVFSAGGGTMVLTDAGRLGVGVTNPSEKLEVNGTVKCGVLKLTGGADLAEPFDIGGASAVQSGMVVGIDPARPGKLRLCDRAYDRCVAGVVSGAGGIGAGLLMGQPGSPADGEHPVALSGRVFCRATTRNGSIEPGDLLTTSDLPGHAMKVTDHTRAQGAVLGKAMTSLTQGTGLVLVLVTLQ